MAPAGPATMTMATSPATSASRSLLIELPSTARRDGAVPARGPRCLVLFPRAVAGVCAYRMGCVDMGCVDCSRRYGACSVAIPGLPRCLQQHVWLPVRMPLGAWPLGGVERPRRVVRFARLMHRRVRPLRRTFGL